MNVAQLAMAVGSFFAGANALSRAFEKKSEETSLAILGGTLDRPRATIVQVHSIDDRLAGVMNRINVSVRDPRIRILAVKLVSRRCREPDYRTGDGGWCIAERDYWREVVTIYNYVRANVRYVRDIHQIDTFPTASRALETHGEDCDGYVITLAALLLAVGFPIRTKTIQTRNAGDWNHIYLQVGLPPTKPTRWRSLDASTQQPPGWEAPRSMIARARLDYPDDPRWRRRR